MKPTAHLHIVPVLRTSGCIPSCPPYALICTNSLTFTKPRYLTLLRGCFIAITVNRVATFLFRQDRDNLKASRLRMMKLVAAAEGSTWGRILVHVVRVHSLYVTRHVAPFFSKTYI